MIHIYGEQSCSRWSMFFTDALVIYEQKGTYSAALVTDYVLCFSLLQFLRI